MIIEKIKKVNSEEKVRTKNEKASDMMIGKWVKCEECKEIIYKEDLHKNLSVCPNCGKHFRLSSRRRIKQIADEGTFKEIGKEILTENPLEFEGYLKKVEILKEKTKLQEAVTCGICEINGEKAVLGVMDSNFLMGSMGSAVGERITLAKTSSAIARNIMEMSNLKVPIICIVIGEGASGGALAIAVGDKIVMLENAIDSILSPEGFASILYKDSSKAKEAAENMKITANDLKN